MTRQDIIAAKAVRKSTLKSLKAKRESRVKAIQEHAAEEIRNVNIQFAADPERLKAKYAVDAAYKSERAKRKSLKKQKRAEERIAYEINQKKNDRLFSFAEELFNSITIGIGAGLAVAALILLIVRAAQFAAPEIATRTLVSYILTGSFLFLLYTMSTLAHALGSYAAKRVFRILSYDFGFLWAASVLSLFALVIIGSTLGWVIFGCSWAMAVFAVAFYSSMEIHPKGRKRGMQILLILFVILVVFELVVLSTLIPAITGKLLIMALVSIAVAELFHAMKNIKWTNAVFHLFAIIANTFGFFAVYWAI